MLKDKALEDLGEIMDAIKESLSGHGFTREEREAFLNLIYAYGMRRKIIERWDIIETIKEEVE
jgi:hypothetical protein